MKLVDKKSGKVLGINAFDLFLLIIIIAFAGYYAYENFLPPPQEVNAYSGLNINNAALGFSRLSGMGYIVSARIDGIWTSNKTEFHDDVLITWSYETRLFGWYKGRRITIGGPNAYVEDIAATKITFKTESPSVIRAYTYPLEGETLTEIADKLEEISRKIAGDYGVKTVKLRSSLVIDVPGLKPNAYLYNRLKWSIYDRVPWGYPYLYLGDSFITITFDYTQKISLTTEDLKEIDSILRELNITYDRAVLDAAYVYIGTKEPLTGVSVYSNILENARPLSGVIDVTRLTYIPKP